MKFENFVIFISKYFKNELILSLLLKFEITELKIMFAFKMHSVIQTNNQQSVIQTAQVITKGNVILVSKPNSVIQTSHGNISALQVVKASNCDDNYSDDDQSKKRRDTLTRRPSYRKILNDLGGVGSNGSGEISGKLFLKNLQKIANFKIFLEIISRN